MASSQPGEIKGATGARLCRCQRTAEASRANIASDVTPPQIESCAIQINTMKTQNRLAEWLQNPNCAAFFGRAFKLKAEVLAYLITGEGSLPDIAARNGVTRQAVAKHHARAKRIFAAS